MIDVPSVCGAFLDSISYDSRQPVLVAVSGGLDSMVLAVALQKAGVSIVVCHCDFGLRPSSQKEAEMVCTYFSEAGIEVRVKKFQTAAFAKEKGMSVQLAARKLRYDWFEELAESLGCQFVATAHHADDNAETLLLHFIKGNSPALLKGIPAKRGIFIRPLLSLHKIDLVRFAKQERIPWMEDESNRKNIYERNHIRNVVIPAIRKINPSFSSHLLQLQDHYQNQKNILLESIAPLEEKYFRVLHDHSEFDCGLALREAGEKKTLVLLDFLLEDMGWSGHLANEIRRLIYSGPGKIVVGRKLRAEKDRDTLIFSPIGADGELEFLLKEEQALDWEMHDGRNRIRIRRNEDLPRFFRKEVWYLDGESIRFPLRFRRWKEGDRMIPLGMTGFKKLSDIFADEKFSLFEKRNAWVLEDQEKIIGVSGFRISEACRVGEQSKFVYEISFHA